MKIVPDSFGAYLVEGATFTSVEEYPVIKADLVSKDFPNKIMPFEKAYPFKGDLRDTYICFYCHDRTFERIRRNPRDYISFFKRTAGIIGFDYSIHSDMPILKQKSQMYENLALTYFFAKQGIKAIPNLRCGIEELEEEFFSAIPKGCIVAMGTHGFIKNTYQKTEWFCFIEKVIKTLDPTGIVIYGTLKDDIMKKLNVSIPIRCYPAWISKYRGKSWNGNERSK